MNIASAKFHLLCGMMIKLMVHEFCLKSTPIYKYEIQMCSCVHMGRLQAEIILFIYQMIKPHTIHYNHAGSIHVLSVDLTA